LTSLSKRYRTSSKCGANPTIHFGGYAQSFRTLSIEIRINQSQYVRLHNLCAEKGAEAYITLEPTEEKTWIYDGPTNKSYVEYRIQVHLSPKLLSETTTNKIKS
jgi:hypothetical protein